MKEKSNCQTMFQMELLSFISIERTKHREKSFRRSTKKGDQLESERGKTEESFRNETGHG